MRSKKYTVNDDYFKKWSNNMAYVLGLWFADGYIDVKRNVFSICLHKNDQYLLKIILKEMELNTSLIQSGNTMILKITSRTIVEDIQKLGGKSRKSLDVKFPMVHQKYLNDFIRGLWDGDGCISNHKWRGYNYYRASLSSGSKEFIYVLKNVLNKNICSTKGFIEKRVQAKGTIIKGQPLRKDSTVYQLNFGINDTRRLREFMYYDEFSNFKMIRKYEKFKESGDIKFTKPVVVWTYAKAHKYVRDNLIEPFKIDSKTKWFEYIKLHKKPQYIPADPYSTYKNKGWIDWYEWLGKKRKGIE